MSVFGSLGRRSLLQGGLGLFALTALGPARVWANPAFRGNPFTLGVASGDPLPDGVVLWTRLAPEPLGEHGGMPMLAVEVNWQVSEDENFVRIVREGVGIARPELGHSVHVEVSGLQPARPYFYRFFLRGGEKSMTGRTKTAPAPGSALQSARIASVGCQHYESGFFTAYRHLSNEDDLDLVFHYGDYIYEGRAGAGGGSETGGPRSLVREHVGPEIYTLEDYRRRYAQYKMDADLQAAHASAPFVMSYDDHEVDNDWASVYDQDGVPQHIFELRKFAALQAWYENLPVRIGQFPRGGAVKLYRNLDYGDLFRMHVLDTRAYRSQQLCDARNKSPCRAQDDAKATMLGQAQEEWLNGSLDNRARWNFVAQQIMFMPYDFRKEGAPEPWTSSDDWIGYPAARERFKKTIRERNLTNVVIGTGNSHRHIAAHVPVNDAEPEGPAIAVEFMSSSISSSGDSDVGWTGQEAAMRNNPHMALMELQRGYQVYDVTPQLWTTHVKVMEHVGSPGGRISTLARYAVAPDRPVLERI